VYFKVRTTDGRLPTLTRVDDDNEWDDDDEEDDDDD